MVKKPQWKIEVDSFIQRLIEKEFTKFIKKYKVKNKIERMSSDMVYHLYCNDFHKNDEYIQMSSFLEILRHEGDEGLVNYLDELEEIKDCPMCKKPIKYGLMVWLDGLCTCPECHKARRDDLKKVFEAGRSQGQKERKYEEEEL